MFRGKGEGGRGWCDRFPGVFVDLVYVWGLVFHVVDLWVGIPIWAVCVDGKGVGGVACGTVFALLFFTIRGNNLLSCLIIYLNIHTYMHACIRLHHLISLPEPTCQRYAKAVF